MGIKVRLKTFLPQQLRIVSHARLLLSMINCSNRDFFAFRKLGKSPARAAGRMLISDRAEWFKTRAWRQRNFLWKRRKGSEYVLAKFNEFVFHSCFPDFVLHFSNWLVWIIFAICGRASSTISPLVSLPLKSSRSLAFRWQEPKSLSRNRSLASLQFSDGFGRGRWSVKVW